MADVHCPVEGGSPRGWLENDDLAVDHVPGGVGGVGRGEHLVAHRVVDDADAQFAGDAEREGHREEGDALRVIQAPADRVDDPQALGVDGQWLVLRTLLRDDPVVWAGLADHLDDEVLDLDRMRRGDRVAAAVFITRYSSRIHRRISGKLSPGMRRVFDTQEIFSTFGRRLDQLVRRSVLEQEATRTRP